MTLAAGRKHDGAAPPGAAPILLLAGLAVAIWGGTPIVTKLAVAEVDPTLVGLLRTVLALPVALALIALHRGPRPRGGDWGLVALSGVAGFCLFPVLFSVGQARTSAAHGGLILAALPVVTGLIAAGVARRWPARLWLLGAALALAGEAALIRFGAPLLGDGGRAATLAGDLILLASALAAGSGYVAGAHLAGRVGALAATLWSLALAGALLAPAALWHAPDVAWGALSPQGWASLGYLALLSSIVGYGLWFRALDRGGIVRIAPVQFLQPLCTLALAVAVLGEPLSVPLLLAGGVILAGVAPCQRARDPQPEAAS